MHTEEIVKCEFLTGPAGSGKTYSIAERVRADPSYGILCATTGVAAVNTGSITLHSLLKFFDIRSLEDAYTSQRLVTRLAELAKQFRHLIIDEVSMLSAEALDILYRGLWEANQYAQVRTPMGLILTGDFAQLPPINEPWAFRAQCWPHFEANTTVLDTNWRQTSDIFRNALGHARAGRGADCLEALESAGVKMYPARDIDFPGTTILARNVDVDRHNYVAYCKLRGAEICVPSHRWGEQRGEWRAEKGLIPAELKLRIGAYVMILANDAPKFSYVNGDCGYVEDFNKTTRKFSIRLARTGGLVEIGTIDRHYQVREEPERAVRSPRPVHVFCQCEPSGSGPNLSLRTGPMASAPRRIISPPWGVPSFNCAQGTWNIGAVRYYPLRLAYAATVHKCQGLTLDRVQIDFRNFFFSSPAMLYVALSRCRTPEGLRLVGTGQQFIDRVRASKEVEKWL